MTEPNKFDKERPNLSQEEETDNIEIFQPQPLTDTEDLTETTKESEPNPKPEGQNGAQSMDEDLEENTDDELKEEEEEEREVKEETMEDQDLNVNRDSDMFLDGEDSGNEDEQAAFMYELERFHKEHNLEYKPPKFYGKGLNCLKLWRHVIKLGGYETVTSCKYWRQVGESFRPPKTCTTISWSFRIFYEKSLLEYEKHKIRSGELQLPESSIPEAIAIDRQVGIGNQSGGSNRVRRDAAQRAMEGWHSQRLLGNGEDKSMVSAGRKDKHVRNVGGSISHKKKKTSSFDRTYKADRTRIVKSDSDSMVIDVGPPADWVKVNVRQTKDCYEVYALVPGLLREEVHVQSDPAGRLVISGEPENADNPWGVTPFKKVISLPSRIDPHQTSAVVTLHGQLFVRVPFENLDV